MDSICDLMVREPYPIPTAEGVNPRYAGMLLSLYSGVKGKMTAVGQYTYQQIRLKDADPETAALLECIGTAERKHLELLGRLIFLLGGDPRYQGMGVGRGRAPMVYWWTGEAVSYVTDKKQMLSADLTAERNAIRVYGEAIRQIGDPGVRAVLERILKDEEKHASLLEERLQEG